MIKAEHQYWAKVLFDFYERRILKKSFSNFYLVNEAPQIPKNKSLLVTPNHISWWDGFFINYVAKYSLQKKLHLMILESSLKKYWYFKKVGAFSINPDNKVSIAETFKYVRSILSNNNNFVVTYPQGEIEDFSKRPLSLKNGIGLLVKPIVDETIILPIGFKIQYYEKKNPSVLCRFGSLIEPRKIIDDFKSFENEFVKNLDLLSQAAIEKKIMKDIL
jgi:1-acyl-sn-glycerol-3-phosphate acyltransferase